MAWRLAIDFGTSNTAAAIDVQGVIRPIALSDGGITMPSAIVLTPSGFRVGEEAINAQLRHPDGFERTPKALIGRGEIVLAGQIVKPDALITEVYSSVRESALRRQNGEAPSEVWLTHPVAWAPSQIEAIRNGAIAAGFHPDTIRTVPEPIAAAAHYARNHQAAPGSRVAVFDFGGGTLDIAVLERDPSRAVGYQVLAYGGDPVLGGRTFDARLLDWTLETLAARGHAELADRLHRPKTMAELRAQTSLSRAVTAAKTELSTRPDADISVSLGDEDAVVTITRAEYEKLIADDIGRAAKLLTDVFDRVSGPAPEVLYLTGGSSRTPAISHMIRERTPIQIATLDDPKLVVAEGALHVGARAAGGHGGASGGQGRASGGMPPRQATGAPFAGQPPRASGAPAQPTAPVARPQSTPQSSPSQPSQPGPRPQPAPRPMPVTQQSTSQYPSGPAASFAGGSGGGRSGGPGASSSNSTTPFGAAGGASGGGNGARKKPKTGLLIGIAAAALVLVGGGIWGATALMNNSPRPTGGGGGGETTAVETEIAVDSGTIDCWDGAKAPAGANCAKLEGEAALNWVVKVSGATCTPTYEAGSSATECTWYDLENVHLFVMRFGSPEEAQSHGESTYGGAGSEWTVGGEKAGTTWEGAFDQSPGGYSHYFVYEGQPYAVFARMDNNANGTHNNLSDFSSRFTPQKLSDLEYAIATTKRV